MNERKELKDLNLLDRFLFAEATEDPDVLEAILEIILGKEMILKHLPQAEKEKRKALWSKIIRLDVLAVDTDSNVYNTEVQKQNTGNIPRRSRFYNGVIDSKLLAPGNIDYNELSNTFIITIMPFDLFGEDRFVYTFSMMCHEIPGLELEDGAKRIFLNTRGKNAENVSEELIALLHYFETSTTEIAEKSGSEKIRKIHEKIETIKSSEEVGIKLMNAWEERILDRREAFEEGKAEGKLAIAQKMLQMGMEPAKISEATGLTEKALQALREGSSKPSGQACE